MAIDASKIDNINNILNPKDSKSAKAKNTLSNDLNDFLKLLTTQLKNQDPTQPFDTNQFTQQIASLSQVEQQINTNKNLESMISLFTSSQFSNIAGYIGKRVETDGNKSLLTVDGGVFIYDLPSQANSVDVSISDAAGNVVFKGTGDTRAGRNEVFWDGVNSFNGKAMDQGVYTLAIKAKDKVGAEIKSTTSTTGRITAVDMQDGKPTLMMGDYKIPLDKVRAIREDPLHTT
jgi:flagellar basal-body rod modification protein FlgD